MKYTIEKYKYFIKLNDKERLIKINQCIILNNGIIKYLSLDDVDYVNKLTRNFQWNKKGIEVFEELVNYRYNYKENMLYGLSYASIKKYEGLLLK